MGKALQSLGLRVYRVEHLGFVDSRDLGFIGLTDLGFIGLRG